MYSMLLLYSQPAKNKEYINSWVHVSIVYAHLTCILRHHVETGILGDFFRQNMLFLGDRKMAKYVVFR